MLHPALTIEEVREQYPAVFQWIWQRVKPEREQNNRDSYRDNWWVFGEPRSQFRPALAGLSRYIATVETSKHRFFLFLDASILPDNMLVNIATDDALFLGALSSRMHVRWALATGGTLEDRPRYNKTRCFETFPFPACTETQKQRIRDLGEQLDAHRKRQQAAHPELTLTGMYNVLEKLRKGEPLTAITTTPKAPKGKQPWPSSLPAQFQALREALARQPGPVDPPGLAWEFQKAKPERVAEMLDTLVILGHARRLPDGRFSNS